MTYQRLIEDHDGIDRLAVQLDRLTKAERPDPARASKILADLAAAVSDHLAYEDRAVYSRLLDAGAPKAMPTIDFEASFQESRADWVCYLAEWASEMVACDWPTFCQETEEMMARLRQRVRDETDLIYPAAMQQGYIRLRNPDAALVACNR